MRPFFGGTDRAPAPGMVHSFRTTVTGTLAFYAESKNRLQFWMLDPKVEITVDGAPSEEASRNLARAVEYGSRAEYVLGAHLSGGSTLAPAGQKADPLAQGLWTALLTRIQWNLPKDASSSKWETTESAPNGFVGYGYELMPPTSGRFRFSKKALVGSTRSYLAHDPVEPIVEETATFEIDNETGLLYRLESEQKTKLLAGSEMVGASESSLILEPRELTPELLTRLEKLRANSGRLRSAGLPMFLTGPEAEELRRRPMEERRLKSKRPAEVWAEFDRAIGKPDSEALPAFLTLKALLYLEPRQCLEAKRRLISAKFGAPLFQALSTALADVGNPEAQAALRECFRARIKDKRAAMELAASIGAIKFPEDATIATLQGPAEDSTDPELAATCVLALGRMANSLVKYWIDRSAPIMEWLLQHANKARNDEDLRVAMLALGNTGDSRALNLLLEGTSETNPSVRAAAAVGLRWIPAKSARTRLSELIATDQVPEVRSSAVGALGYQKASEPLLIPALSDKAAAVRVAALEALGKQGKLTEATLQKVAGLQSDPDKSVREMAAALLSR